MSMLSTAHKRAEPAVGRSNVPAAAWAAIDLSPFITYALLTSVLDAQLSAAAALAVALALVARHALMRRIKPLSTVGAVGFAVLLVAPWPAAIGLSIMATAVVLTASASLLTATPLMFVYARDDWHPVTWDDALFRKANSWATGALAITLLVAALVAVASVNAPLLRVVVAVLTVAAAVISEVVLIQYARRSVARRIAEREPYHWQPPRFSVTEKRDADVVVVGAGVAGLTAGALLAQRGLRVTVAEQHFLPGGFCTTWERGVRRGDTRLRYVFDAGVHDFSGLGPNGPIRNVLRRLGIEDRLEWRAVTHEYDVDGFRLKVPPNVDEFVAALGDAFPADRQRVGAFFGEVERVYRQLYADSVGTGGVPRLPATVEEMMAYPISHPHAFHWMDRPFGELMDAYLSEPKLRHTVSVLSEYLTDNPRALSVMSMAPIFGYYFDGGYYPVGGSMALPTALVTKIEESGGRVRLRTPVRRILVDSGRATGIELKTGERITAQAVISNADVKRTFTQLLAPEHVPAELTQRIDGLKPSNSAFVVFLGLDMVPDLEPVVMVANDEEKFGIAIPSKVDPSLAPNGHASVSVVRLVSQAEAATWDRTDPGYHMRKRLEGDRLLERAERLMPGLRNHIVYRQEGAPPTFGRYAWTSSDSIYGPTAGQPLVPARTPIEGLLLAGAGVFPGAGIEAAVISGTLAADALSTPLAAPIELRHPPHTNLAA